MSHITTETIETVNYNLKALPGIIDLKDDYITMYGVYTAISIPLPGIIDMKAIKQPKISENLAVSIPLPGIIDMKEKAINAVYAPFMCFNPVAGNH